jgi:glucose-1-phosphate cytidylyltransferase
MKALILCGGRGTRLSEETRTIPKPLVRIGNIPIVVHIINSYMNHGVFEFVLAVGYKGEEFNEYFSEINKDVLKIVFNQRNPLITILDTGEDTLTGGRLLRTRHLITDSHFLLTYGDGLTNANIKKSIDFHNAHGSIATITAVRPPARFGVLHIKDSGKVDYFQEKNQTDAGWINGGYFVLSSEVFDYLDDDLCVFEEEPLRKLTSEGELIAYKHDGFWQCMDTLRDKEFLEDLWKSGEALWK